MRVVLLAIGRMKKGPETELVERYLKRAEQAGRQIGLRGVEIIEIRESRAADAGKRMVEESIALANVIPEGAVTVMLDERGDNLGSADFADHMRKWRDAGVRRGGFHHWRPGRTGPDPARQSQAETRLRGGDLAASDGQNHAFGAGLSGDHDSVRAPLSS